MSKPSADYQQGFEQLLAALVDGELAESDRRRLNELLHEHPEARQTYIAMMALHAKLHARHAATDTSDMFPSPASLGRFRSAMRRPGQFIARPTPLSLVVAAMVLAGLLGLLAIVTPPIYNAVRGVNDPPEVKPSAYVAVVANMHQAKWAAEQAELAGGSHIGPGQRLKLSAGLVEIRYRTGEIVILEGPADFTVKRHPQQAACGWGELKAGTLTADVPANAVGFTIETPAARVVDLGTSFGVAVAGGATEVHVLSGKVEAHVGKPGAADVAVVRIERGQAYHVEVGGVGAQQIAYADEQFTRGLPLANRHIDPYAAAVLADRPIGYWPLSERSSTVAVNWAGRPHGAYRGDIARDGSPRPGDEAPVGSANFDGQNDCIEVLHDGRLSPEDFTLEAWVRLDRVPRDHASILTSRGAPSPSTGYVLYISPQGEWAFWTGAAKDWDKLTGPAASVGAWTHIAATFQRIQTHVSGALTGVKRLYVNGALVAEDAESTYFPQSESTLPLRIGGGATEQQSPKYFFHGQLADVAVYTRAISAAEIAEHVASAAPAESTVSKEAGTGEIP